MRFEWSNALKPAPVLRSKATLLKRCDLMSDRLYRLMLAHQRIDEQLRREQRRRGASPFPLMRLKKLKLRAKDLMQRLSRSPQQG